MRMLVAENDPALATFLHDRFSAEHYTLDLTGDGEEVQRWVEERNYHVVILDRNLVRAGAAEAVQFVRSKRRQLPILVLYSRNRAEEGVQILDVGADDLVLKPFAFSEPCARVRALLRRGGRSAEAVEHRGLGIESRGAFGEVRGAGDRADAQGIWAAGVLNAPCRTARQARADHPARVESVVRYDVCIFRRPVFLIDNVPIHNEKYDSNCELSTARATEIIKLFITKFAVAPDRLSASGYAEYYPTASNDTAEGRATNRRVDLVILNSISDAGVPTPTVIAPDAVPSATAPR